MALLIHTIISAAEFLLFINRFSIPTKLNILILNFILRLRDDIKFEELKHSTFVSADFV